MSQTEENDDLYGDLNITKDEASGNSSASKKNSVKEIPAIHSILHLDKEVMEKLKAELTMVKKENETLRRNIGTLYRTAKMELERKDTRILGLEENLKRADY